MIEQDHWQFVFLGLPRCVILLRICMRTHAHRLERAMLPRLNELRGRMRLQNALEDQLAVGYRDRCAELLRPLQQRLLVELPPSLVALLRDLGRQLYQSRRVQATVLQLEAPTQSTLLLTNAS
jgi:hypothetical protein